MKVAICKDTLANRRGADFAVMGLSDGLAESGHDVSLLERAEYMARLGERLWDVVISAGTNELLDMAELFPVNFPFPVIQQFHTTPRSQFKVKRLLRNWRIRRALRRTSAIQVLCDWHLPQVSGYGVPVHVIGNWSRMEGGGAERTDAGPSRTIVYPAAFAKSKNHRLLVDAFSSLAPEFPDWTLELYGAGNAPFDLPRGVRAMGFREDLSSAWARCAFLAFPSLDEGFPLSIVDAAAFGKPALTVRDWIGAAASGGGVVAGTSVREYAEGMRKLMSDPALCGKMGDAARHFCSDSYSKAAIMAAWEALLRQCAG